MEKLCSAWQTSIALENPVHDIVKNEKKLQDFQTQNRDGGCIKKRKTVKIHTHGYCSNTQWTIVGNCTKEINN